MPRVACPCFQALPNNQASAAICTHMRFSASSTTREYSLSSTSSLTSTLRRTGSQCIRIASEAAFSKCLSVGIQPRSAGEATMPSSLARGSGPQALA